jgi:DNA processing protein
VGTALVLRSDGLDLLDDFEGAPESQDVTSAYARDFPSLKAVTPRIVVKRSVTGGLGHSTLYMHGPMSPAHTGLSESRRRTVTRRTVRELGLACRFSNRVLSNLGTNDGHNQVVRREGVMDEFTSLLLAVVASRHGDARLMPRARELGTTVFTDLLCEISRAEQERANEEASELADRGVGAVLLGSPEYPHLLSRVRAAPPFLFYMGAADLLTAQGIGMCGSRNASDEGLRAAAACGEVATQRGLTVVSGYARGVDTTTHVSALSSGGSTVIVLPEGINHFRVKRGPVADVWDKERALVVSQFLPSRPWSAASAMARNNVIIGLSLALVVVEARDKGGTIATGTKALQLNKPVLALEFAMNPRGNAELIRNGAISVRNRAELRTRLLQITKNPQGNQLSII